MANYKDLCKNIDWERKVIVTPWGQKFHFEEQSPGSRFFVFKSRHAERVKSLDLSIQEEAILRAILLLSVGKIHL